MNDVLDVYLWQGLGNRINCLASALATGRPLHIVWARNRECPLPYDDVFARHPQVVRVSQEVGQTYAYFKGPGVLSWYYPINLTGQPWADFLPRLKATYAEVLQGLLAKHSVDPLPQPLLGVQVREHFSWYEKATLRNLIGVIKQVSEQSGFGDVWLMVDRDPVKKRLMGRLETVGLRVHAMNYPDLKRDLDRKDSIRSFLRDFAHLAQAQAFVVNNSRSTVTDAFLFDGRPIHYAFDDGYFRRRLWPEFYQFSNVAIYDTISGNITRHLHQARFTWPQLTAGLARPGAWTWTKFFNIRRRFRPLRPLHLAQPIR